MQVYTHQDMWLHHMGSGHVESPDRLRAVLGALEQSDLDYETCQAPLLAQSALEQVHGRAHLRHLQDPCPKTGLRALDADTALSPGSWRAACLAAGAVQAAILAVHQGQTDRAFCAIRPPGHHATPDTAMGFCLLSNIALGVAGAKALGFQRIAVVDFDVHHGNGTEAALGQFDLQSVFFGSIHQSPLYPYTGQTEAENTPTRLNIPIAPHVAAQAWRSEFEQKLMAPLDAFAPDLILISAGFDAHRRDPLAHQSLEASDFAHMTRALVEIAKAHAKGRIVSSLEGGYDLQALGQSALAHVDALVQP